MTVTQNDNLMTVDEIAEYLGLSKSTVYRLARCDEIPAYKLAKTWRFSREEVLKWMNTEKCKAVSQPKLQIRESGDWKRRAYMEVELKKQAAKLLVKTGVLKGFTASEVRTFVENVGCERRIYSRNEVVIRDSEKMEYMYLIESGRLYISLDKSDNTMFTKKFLQRGEQMGFDVMFTERRTSYMKVFSEGETKVIVFPVDNVFKYIDEQTDAGKRFMSNVARLLADENIRRMKHIRILSDKKTRSRIMFYLDLEEKKNGGSPFPLIEGRLKMASHLGINRTVLSHELQMLKNEGYIDYDRNMFTILKR